MSTSRLVLLFKTILPVRSTGYFLVTLLVLVLAPQSVLAINGKKATMTITVGQTTVDGELSVKFTATVDNNKDVIDLGNIPFKTGLTPEQVAEVIKKIFDRQIKCKKLKNVKLSVEGALVTVKFDPESVSISVPSNTTGAETNLTITSDGSNLFWSLYRWPYVSNAVVPAGIVMTMTATEPNGTTLSVSVTGDGVMTVNRG